MNNIQQLELEPTNYTGSKVTAEIVKSTLKERYGEEVANNWRPEFTRTFRNWLMLGYRVLPGQKAIRTFTLIKGKDDKTWKKPVFLFHINQCIKN